MKFLENICATKHKVFLAFPQIRKLKANPDFVEALSHLAPNN